MTVTEPPPAEVLAGRLGVGVAELRAWAARVAHRVRRAYRFPAGSAEADDLTAEADRALCERAAAFDPAQVPPGGNPLDAFKGYSYDWIKDACRKEAERLRGGGTFRTVRPEHRPAPCAPLGDAAAAVAGTDTPHAEPVSRVKVNGIPYALPFETLFRPLSAAEAETLEASILFEGVLDPPTACTLTDRPDLGDCLIDGANRCTVADRLGLPVPVPIDLGPMTTAEAREKAEALNAARRMLTPEELADQRKQLVTRVALARKSGKSLRTIARENGVKHARQVLRMLRAAGFIEAEGVTGVTPGTVIGSDGVAQPARKPPATAAAVAASAGRALDTAFRKLAELIRLDRDRVVALAEVCDIPFTNTTPGREAWPALAALTVLRGLLGRVG